jgi:hypothetical protein
MRSTSDGWPDDRLPRVPSSGNRWTRASELAERLHHVALVAVFLTAVGRLFFVRGFSLGGLVLFCEPPLFAYVYLRVPDTSVWTRRLAWSFFALIAIGILLAPIQGILPRLNCFPDLPRTENRLLSWYMAVYMFYMPGILPPYIAVRNLWLRSHERPADFSRPTCWLILFAWSLLMLALGGGARQLFDIMFPAMILFGMLP